MPEAAPVTNTTLRSSTVSMCSSSFRWGFRWRSGAARSAGGAQRSIAMLSCKGGRSVVRSLGLPTSSAQAPLGWESLVVVAHRVGEPVVEHLAVELERRRVGLHLPPHRLEHPGEDAAHVLAL